MLGSLMPVWARWAILLAACAALYGTGRIHQARDDQTEQIERDHKRMVANVDRLARRARGQEGRGRARGWEIR